ncbi:MAG: hypothetical protein GXO77_04080 [Calditrichaeota bacterium]|nr:hypothetical protein [Calditrichota bacterium]
MAEQFHKIYISASEFVKAWEKEVYELTNLDYFIYLTMNTLAEYLETIFFPSQRNIDEQFLLDNDEITNLAFHLGDNLQLFFDKNCFGICSMNCPIQLDQKITSEDFLKAGKVPENMEFTVHSCSIKEHCLKYDLLNYVIIDAILDFYRYDLNISAEDDHPILQQLIQFVNETMIDLVRRHGNHLLVNPQENASSYFENLINSEETTWNEYDFWSFEEQDHNEPDELWKLPNTDLFLAIEEFKQLRKTSATTRNDILELFGKFVNGFIGSIDVKELSYDDLEEFLMIVLPTEMCSEPQINFEREVESFSNFLKFLDYQYEANLSLYWDDFETTLLNDLKRTFYLGQAYHKNNSYVDYQLSEEKNDPSIIDGFFEVVDRVEDLFVIEDIHLKDQYSLVDLSMLEIESVFPGDILNMQIVEAGDDKWKAIWIECVFAPKSKYYLL